MDCAGAADDPSEGKASTESTAGAALDEPFAVEVPFDVGAFLGVGALPSVGKGSGAPSRPWRWDVSRVHRGGRG
jgi:hypothetical protein